MSRATTNTTRRVVRARRVRRLAGAIGISGLGVAPALLASPAGATTYPPGCLVQANGAWASSPSGGNPPGTRNCWVSLSYSTSSSYAEGIQTWYDWHISNNYLTRNGVYNTNTRDAIEGWQYQGCGYSCADGVVGPGTWYNLQADVENDWIATSGGYKYYCHNYANSSLPPAFTINTSSYNWYTLKSDNSAYKNYTG
jgi:peptidoglycan hydrolase-like protein with peptidoglycan-binding domain